MTIDNLSFTQHTVDDFIYLTAPNIGTKHAFTTRYGGVSGGVFSQESMDALCKALKLSPENIAYSKQVHGSDIRVVTHASKLTPKSEENPSALFTSRDSYSADAIITRTPGIALMIFTADCIPILLHDPICEAVGAVHAGWRGTALGIAAAAVKKMAKEFGCCPENIHAAIGPGISKCCFETNADVADALREIPALMTDNCITEFDTRKPMPCTSNAADTQEPSKYSDSGSRTKYMIDLKEANRQILVSAGVKAENISVSDDCTVCADGGHKYWSHRCQGTNRGSQATVVIL